MPHPTHSPAGESALTRPSVDHAGHTLLALADAQRHVLSLSQTLRGRPEQRAHAAEAVAAVERAMARVRMILAWTPTH